jgi:hypothetical protein
MNRLTRAIDQVTRAMDHPARLGQKAIYKSRTYGAVDASTGIQAVSVSSKNVTVRSWPLTMRDQIEFARAGLAEAMTRWCMRSEYHDDVKAGDVVQVGSFEYEVLESPTATLDEFGIDWTIYTRRKRF